MKEKVLTLIYLYVDIPKIWNRKKSRREKLLNNLRKISVTGGSEFPN